ncbi:MAG: hypothetical protein WC662_00845 [Candidatus Paceibacterota bacterium]
METRKTPQVAIAESAKAKQLKIVKSYYEDGIYADSIPEGEIIFYLVSDNVRIKKQNFRQRLFGIKKFVEPVKIYAEIVVNKGKEIRAEIYGSDNLEIVKEILSPVESAEIKVELVIVTPNPLTLENQIYYNIGSDCGHA